MGAPDAARPDLLGDSALKEWIVDPEDQTDCTAAVYRWDSGHMGYSYWVCTMKPNGDPVAVELLPEEMAPREKEVSDIQENGEYIGQLHGTIYETVMDLWYAKWQDGEDS